MTGRETAGKNDGRFYVRRSQNGSLVLRLSELAWETEFFGRRFGRLAVDVEGIQDLDERDLDESLQEVLSYGDQNGFGLIDLELDASWTHLLCLFEDRGFRFVDTKLRFLTLKQREEMQNLPPPTRETCFASEEMKEEILALTRRAFANNPSFKSRFKNESFFSRSEMERYYAAWIENSLGDRKALFAVARDEGKILGYLVYARTGEHEGKPLHKAVLMAVDPDYHGRGVYFDLRSFVYAQFPEPEVYLDTTTQLGNLSAIRNLIRTRKALESIRFCFYRRGPGESAGVHTGGSPGGTLALGLSEMQWETEFFGRRFGRLEVDTEGVHDIEADALDRSLKNTLSSGDQSGFDVIEVQLDMSWLHHVHLFESNGFRLVDTKLRFLAPMTKEGMDDLPTPEGEVGFASVDMKEELLSLTHSAFTDNPSFKSRFKNERFFTRSDTERYYAAWIENYLGDPDTLFAVMSDKGKVVGYLVYTKTGEYRGKPLYKAALIAVAPEYRGRRIYFAMRSFVFEHFPVSEAYLDMTTQLSNLSTIRNLIKAQRNLHSIQLVFYRIR